jgi:hypothetical protein
MEKKRCGTCIFLAQTRKEGNLCLEKGKNKGCPACKSWEPNIESLSNNVKSIITLLGQCKPLDIPILEWILKKQQYLLDNNSLFRIGTTVWYFVEIPDRYAEDQIYQILIQNVTSKYIVGKDMMRNAAFFLPLNARVYTSKEELIKDQEEFRKQQILAKQNHEKECAASSVGLNYLEKVKNGIVIKNIEE